MKFRRKPIVVDAIRWMGDNPGELAQLMGSYGNWLPAADGAIIIPVSNGVYLTVYRNDWILRDVKGEFSSCKSDIFEETYERVG